MREALAPGSLSLFWRAFRETAHLMVGLPDYQRYVAHVAARHPGKIAMTKAEFVAERTARRYEGRGVGRCC